MPIWLVIAWKVAPVSFDPSLKNPVLAISANPASLLFLPLRSKITSSQPPFGKCYNSKTLGNRTFGKCY